MNYLHTIKTQLVELLVQGVGGGNTGTRFYFQDQPFLRSKNLVSLEVYTDADIALSPTNNAVAASAVLSQGFLNLYGNDPETPPINPTSGQTANGGVVSQGEWIQNFPLISLHRVNNQADPFVFMKETFIPRIIVWEKSYINFPVAIGVTVNTSFLFNVGYVGRDTIVS